MLLHFAFGFLVLAVVAGALGFGWIASDSAQIAKVLFFIFIVLFVISFLSRNML